MLEQARLVQHWRVLLSGWVLRGLERHGAARVEGFALRVPVPVVERRDTDSLMYTFLLWDCRRRVRGSLLSFAWLVFRRARALHRAAPADHLCVHGYSMALYHRLTALSVDDGRGRLVELGARLAGRALRVEYNWHDLHLHSLRSTRRTLFPPACAADRAALILQKG